MQEHARVIWPQPSGSLAFLRRSFAHMQQRNNKSPPWRTCASASMGNMEAGCLQPGRHLKLHSKKASERVVEMTTTAATRMAYTYSHIGLPCRVLKGLGNFYGS